MPAKVKGFAYGSIVASIVTFMLTAMIGGIAIRVLDIPIMQKDIKANSELGVVLTDLNLKTAALSVTIKNLNDQALRTNDILQAYVTDNAKNLSQLIGTDMELKARVSRLEGDYRDIRIEK